MVGCWPINEGVGSVLTDVISHHPLRDFVGLGTWTTTRFGMAYQPNSTAYMTTDYAFPLFSVMTLLFVMSTTNGPTSFGACGWKDSAGDNPLELGTNGTNLLLVSTMNTPFVQPSFTITGITFSAINTYVIRAGNLILDLWVNGVFNNGTETGGGSVIYPYSGPMQLLCPGTKAGYNAGTCKFVTAMLWSRVLSNSEVVSVSANPWQVFAAPTTARWLSVPSTPSYTLSGPSSGNINVTSTNFTVHPNISITGTDTITFSDGGKGGTFTPSSLSWSGSGADNTFTYKPVVSGLITLTLTSSNSYVVTNSPFAYTSLSTALSGPPNYNLQGGITGAPAMGIY
jgi:hypothetical protein